MDQELAMQTRTAIARALRRAVDAGDMHAVDTITTQLEAGLVPTFERRDVQAVLVKDAALKNTTAEMVTRVLVKHGVIL